MVSIELASNFDSPGKFSISESLTSEVNEIKFDLTTTLGILIKILNISRSLLG